MSKLQLSFACGTAARLRPILNGTVQPEGMDLVPSEVLPGELFWRVPRFDHFDVAELSLTGYLWGIQHGKRWTAIPVFPAWVFGCHTETLCNVGAGIEKPQDLKGKRVGVPEYPVAAILWIRQALESEYGVRPQDVYWYEERTPRVSHYKLMGYRPPADVSVTAIAEDRMLCEMLLSGEIDAVTRYFGRARDRDPPILADRSNIPMERLAQHPKVRWLFPDRKLAAVQYHEKIGHLQPIHCIIIRREVVENHPWVPLNLLHAFSRSFQLTSRGGYVRPASYEFTEEEQIKVIGPNFWPVGLRANRRAVEFFLELAQRQGFVVGDQKMTVDRFFHESTIET